MLDIRVFCSVSNKIGMDFTAIKILSIYDNLVKNTDHKKSLTSYKSLVIDLLVYPAAGHFQDHSVLRLGRN